MAMIFLPEPLLGLASNDGSGPWPTQLVSAGKSELPHGVLVFWGAAAHGCWLGPDMPGGGAYCGCWAGKPAEPWPPWWNPPVVAWDGTPGTTCVRSASPCCVQPCGACGTAWVRSPSAKEVLTTWVWSPDGEAAGALGGGVTGAMIWVLSASPLGLPVWE